jgi:hypothetical protein
MTMVNRKAVLLGLCLFMLTACGLLPDRTEVLPTAAAPPPSLTRTATRPPLPSAPGATLPAGVASATPDPAIVSETFDSPSGVLSFRYPAGWTVSDRSDAAELLVTAQSPTTAAVSGLFVVNVLNVDGQLRMEDLAAVAEDYLQTLFGDELATAPPTYREEGEFLIATVIQSSTAPARQWELRFASRAPYYLVLVLIAPQSQWDQSASTLDAISRSVVLTSESGTPLPTATTGSGRLTEGLALENATLYTATTGSVYLVGEVSNSSTQPYEGVRADVELLDSGGAVVAQQTWNIERKLLPSGEKSPLVAIFTPAPANVTDFRVSLSAVPATFYIDDLTTQFEVRGVVGSEPAFAAYALRGQVANLGPAAEAITVFGVIYDETGKVLGVGNATVDVATLQTNDQTEFLLTIYSKAEGEVANYTFWVEGTRLE